MRESMVVLFGMPDAPFLLKHNEADLFSDLLAEVPSRSLLEDPAVVVVGGE